MTTKIEVGQIYIAADGGRYGHLVTDTTTHADCDDVVTRPFGVSGWGSDGNLIDGFKLAVVRYSLQTEAPSWMPPTPTP